VTKSNGKSPESSNGKSVLSSAAESAIPRKRRSSARPRSATPSQPRANEVTLGNRFVDDEGGVGRLPIQSEFLSERSHSSSNAHSLNRCVRLTHVAGDCSVCGGFCHVAHLIGDKRARCASCCPVCNQRMKDPCVVTNDFRNPRTARWSMHLPKSERLTTNTRLETSQETKNW
jgi:hypothetical protein